MLCLDAAKDREIPLSGQISHRELHSEVCALHDALSYAGGNALKLEIIRLSDRPLLLWIDAVCLNQEDKNEKTEQVSLTDQTYTYVK